MRTVYIAGPYTKPDPIVNTNIAIGYAEKLSYLGFVPFIPHLTLFWHLLFPHQYEFWLFLDKEWLLKCDCVLRIPGESNGADKEVEYAKEHGIPVFNSIEELSAVLERGTHDIHTTV